MKFLKVIILFVFIMSVSAVALACPVCFAAKGATLSAFRWSTVFLTLMPLIAIAAFFYWYRRKMRKMDE